MFQSLIYSQWANLNSIPWMTTAEAVSSIIIPLPYVLASLAYRQLTTTHKATGSPVVKQPSHEWPIVCGLTSATLLLIGAGGIFKKPYQELDRRKPSLVPEDGLGKRHWMDKARRIGGRFLTVGLPFYATSRLGAARVALVMLVGLATNIMAIEDEATDLTRIKGWKRLFTYRRWTIASILLQLLCDFTGLISGSSKSDLCLGYLALGLSIFALPPSFPSSRPKLSVVTSSAPPSESSTSSVLSTPWETPPKLENSTAKMIKLSPLVCSPEDVALTLWSGGTLALVTIIISFSIGSEIFSTPSHLGWMFLSSGTAATALLTADSRSLRKNKGLGLLLGSLISSLLLTQLGSLAWSVFAYQSGFIGICFAATKSDTQSSFSVPPRSEHHHHQHQPKLHTAEHVQMSRFSEFILRIAPKNQLLHSILVEKDSRRIFYFMW